MRRDRLATVLQLRELIERQRLAERAEAGRRRTMATQALGTANELRAEAIVAPGTHLVPAELSAHRIQVIALGDLIETVEQKVQVLTQEEDAALVRQIAAAVERRSVERLRERRAAVTAKAEMRRDTRRLDEVALQVWRRSS